MQYAKDNCDPGWRHCPACARERELADAAEEELADAMENENKEQNNE